MPYSPHSRAFALRISALVALLSMLAPFSIDTYLPSFPDIARELGATPIQMQQTLSFYLGAFAVMTLAWGPIADSIGRRSVVLWTLALYAAASVGAALADDIDTFTVMRIAQGLTASAGMVLGRALVRDLFGGAGAQKVIANAMLVFSLAPAVAPIIGGWLHELAGWRSVFWLLAAMGLGTWLLVLIMLPETLRHEDRQSLHPVAVGRNYLKALRSPGFMALCSIFALNFGGMFVYIAGAPAVIYDHLGLGAEDFAVLFVPLVAGISLGAFLAGRAAGHRDPLAAIPLGFALSGAAALVNLAQALWLPVATWSVVAPLFFYSLGLALVMPGLSIMALDYFPRNRGMASAMQSFVQTGGNAVIAGAVVPLLTGSILGMAAGTVALNASALGVWLLWRRYAAPPVYAG